VVPGRRRRHDGAGRLALQFRGPCDVHIESLRAKLLELDLPGPGKVDLTGQVVEQRVSVGMGAYSAPGLESKKAKVVLQGIGQATV